MSAAGTYNRRYTKREVYKGCFIQGKASSRTYIKLQVVRQNVPSLTSPFITRHKSPSYSFPHRPSEHPISEGCLSDRLSLWSRLTGFVTSFPQWTGNTVPSSHNLAHDGDSTKQKRSSGNPGHSRPGKPRQRRSFSGGARD